MDNFNLLNKESNRIREDYKTGLQAKKQAVRDGLQLGVGKTVGANYIGATRDAKRKVKNYKQDLKKYAFLYEEKDDKQIDTRIRKYRTLSDRNNESLVKYSVRFTNRSAKKRASSAQEARKRYEEYDRYMRNLAVQGAQINRRAAKEHKVDKTELKEFYEGTMEALDIRRNAMLAAAEVKSTSDDNEAFRKIKIEREILALRVNLTDAYEKKYRTDSKLGPYFKKKYDAYLQKLTENTREYNRRFAKVKGEAKIELEKTDADLQEQNVNAQAKTVNIAGRQWQGDITNAAPHYMNSQLNSVHNVLSEIGGYEVQLDKVKNTVGTNKRIRPLVNHVSRGKEYAQTGHVLKFNVLGTKGTFENRDNAAETEAMIEGSYGKQIAEYDGGVREKNKDNFETGNAFRKISLKGATNSLGVGDYSIDNSADRILELAKTKLRSVFEEWNANKEAERKDIHFMLEGVSRGGVTGMLGAMEINGWVTTEYPQYAKYVKYDVIQRDPVAGPNVSSEKGEVRIGGPTNSQELDENGFIKGTKYKPLPQNATNSTVFYCFHPDVGALSPFFQPQSIYGANRIILTASQHADGGRGEGVFKPVVSRQERNNRNKNYSRRTSYFNNSDGELYTGSGINDLGDGVYVLDEYDTLTKLNSYEDAERIFKGVRNDIVYSKRQSKVLEVVKYWFASH